jgi:hypothetical protein
MIKLDIDTIRRSGDATSIPDRAKALLEVDGKVQNEEMSSEAGIEAAVAIFGNDSPQFKARCELLFAISLTRTEKEDEAVAIEKVFKFGGHKIVAAI